MGEITAGPTGAVATTLITVEWWLSRPSTPGSERLVKVRPDWSPTRPVRAEAHEVVHASYPKVTRGRVRGYRGSMPLRTRNQPEYAAVMGMVYASDTLLLRDVFGNRWYFEVVGDVTETLVGPAAPDAGDLWPIAHLWEIDVPVVEVGPPA